MKLLTYCPLWGMSDLPLEAALQKIKNAGYDGAEIALDPRRMDFGEVKNLFDGIGLRMIAQHPYAQGRSREEYIDYYLPTLEMMADLKPDKINCHTGKDYFSVDDNKMILEEAISIGDKKGISMAHEIHRGTFSYAPPMIQEYLNAFPTLKLTADFSHWCVVTESLLENHSESLNSAIARCIHIHARVGAGETPQVTHPAAPEHEEALKQHTDWWHSIFLEQKKAGLEAFTVTCEFGPVPYMPTVPFTNQPISSQWEVNAFMKKYISEQFQSW